MPNLQAYMPQWLDIIYPVDKTNLDVLRLAHFLALADRDRAVIPARLEGPAIADGCAQRSCADNILWRSSASEYFCLSPLISSSFRSQAA